MRSKQLYIKRAIEASFLRLLDEQPFEKITVKNIVDDCGLTRNTFYNYFEDTYDIVDGLLRSQMCELARHPEQQSAAQATLTQAMRQVSQFAKEHPRAVKHLFRSSKREELLRYFDKACEVTVAHIVDNVIGERPISLCDRRLIVDTYRFIVAGFFKEWVEDDMKTSLEDTLARLDELFAASMNTAIGRAIEKE